MNRVDLSLVASAVAMILLLHWTLAVEQNPRDVPTPSAGTSSDTVRSEPGPPHSPPEVARLTAMVEQPLFFEGRRVPASAPESTAAAGSPSAATAPTGPQNEAPFRLLGVAIVGPRRVAVVEAAGTAEVTSATEGEALGQGWSVARIAADAVTLQRDGTRLALRLFPERPPPEASAGPAGSVGRTAVAAGTEPSSPPNDSPTLDESLP